MNRPFLGAIAMSLVFGSFLIGLFQNCGPAQLTGSTGESSMVASSVGSKVDLAALLLSATEDVVNVIHPTPQASNEYDYAQASPIFENLVLRHHEFNRIVWVHGPTSTIVALGDSFHGKEFSPDLLGPYYVFGYRGSTPYQITHFKLIEKSSSTLGVNSAGAVIVTQKAIDADGTNERILVTVEAPAVDLKAVEIVVKNQGASVFHKRALLVTKKMDETLDVEVILTDLSNQVFSKTVNLPAKLMGPPVTTTTTTTTSTTTTMPKPVFVGAITDGKSYRLTNLCGTADKVMAIKDASQLNQAQAVIETRNVAKNSQIFKVIFSTAKNAYNLVATHSGRYLDIRANSLEEYALIQQWANNGGDNQLFRIGLVGPGIFNLQAVSSGKFIDLNGQGTDDGNHFIQIGGNSTCAQQFKFEEVPNASQPPVVTM